MTWNNIRKDHKYVILFVLGINVFGFLGTEVTSYVFDKLSEDPKAGDFLRNRRVNIYLEGKDDIYKRKFRNIAMLSEHSATEFNLQYIWKEKLHQQIVNMSKCKVIESKAIELKGAGVTVFGNAIDYAVSKEYQAFTENSLNTTRNPVLFDFYKCEI